MQRSTTTVATLSALCCGLTVQWTQAAEDLDIAVRAAPSRAATVDRVLAEYAKPEQFAVPKGMSIDTYLRNRCTSPTAAQAKAASSGQTPSANLFTVSPCAAARRNAQALVRVGDTLEIIARRMGLHASDATSLKVARAGRVAEPSIDPAHIRPGDVVTAGKAPVWTRVRIDASKVQDYPSLLRHFAEALQCGSEEPADCLARLGVFVLDRRPPRPPMRVAAPRYRVDVVAAAHASPASVGTTVVPAAVLAPPPPQLPDPADLTSIRHARVATEQWPYDAELVRRILADAAKGQQLSPTIIGVAEGGLASNEGSPLPAAVFAVNDHETSGGGQDADGNAFVGDTIGAGMARGADLANNGEIEFCYPTAATEYAALTAKLRDDADHGPIVASIAAGIPFRGDPDADRLLPRIVFFRLNQGDCTQEGKLDIPQDAVSLSIDYLTTRTEIINLSYAFDGYSGQMLGRALIPSLGEQLLVVPAGNLPGNLDEQLSCPPCIALPGFKGSSGKLAQWILVVGAATPTLRMTDYSGWGETSVRLFAPGDPRGALDSLGGHVSSSREATSYAAPYAALAAAIMHSLGIKDLPTVVRRMQLATWPLFDAAGKRHPSGILDLAKAVAVRHWSIEVKERDGDAEVLRTYVGHVPDESATFPICGTTRFDRHSFQAVRFGDRNAAGQREVVEITRNVDDSFRLRKQPLALCEAVGSIRIDALRDGVKDIPLQDVTAVIAPL